MIFISTIEHLMLHMKQAPQAIKEGAKWIVAGAPLADRVTVKIRRDTCEACEHWRTEPERCDKCKCLAGKLHLKTAKCPLAKW